MSNQPSQSRRPTATVVRGALVAIVLAMMLCVPVAASPSSQFVPRCGVVLDRDLQPGSVELGQTVDVTLRLQVGCPNVKLSRQYSLAIAAWPSAAEADEVRAAARAFIAAVNLNGSAIGLVLGHSATPTELPPTQNRAALNQALDAYGPSAFGATTDDLLEMARRQLLGPGVPFGRRHIILVTHAGVRPGPAEELTNELIQTRFLAIWLTQLCLGGGCDPLPRTENRAAADRAALDGHLAELAVRPARLSADQILIRDEFAGRVQYVFPSANPPPTRLGETVEVGGQPLAGRGFIEWTIEEPPDAITASYRIRPSTLGDVETHGRLVVEIVDTLARWDRSGLDGARVVVRPAPPAASRCRVSGGAEAGPGPVQLGAMTPVTLTLVAQCQDDRQPADVVLLLDRSLSTRGEPLEQLRSAAGVFFDLVDLTLARVAVVMYNDRPELRQGFSQDRDALRRSLDDLISAGNTNPRAAVDLARQLLAARRADAVPLIVLMYDGHLNVDPTPAVEWARMEGIRIATVCSGGECAHDLASPPEYDVRLEDGRALADFWQRLAAALTHKGLDWLTVVHYPISAFPFSAPWPPGSAAPTLLDDGALQWRRDGLLGDRAQILYRLSAAGTGQWPVARRLEVLWADRDGGTGAGAIAVPELEVLLPPHEGPCTPLVGERGVALASVDVGDPLTVTTRIDIACPPADVPFRVAFVIDHSRSMGFLDRLANARRAVGAFLGKVASKQWQFALVTFNDQVTHAVPLTENVDQILSVLDQLLPEGETNISAAIDRATELLPNEDEGVPRVMIVLTDGRNSAGPGPMIQAAARAQAAGITISTVCMADCDPQLADVASDPSFHFAVPDASDLAALFEQLAVQLLRSLAQLEITDRIGPDLAYGAAPSPPPWYADVDELVWRFGVLPVGGMTVTHGLVGLTPGRHPVSLISRVDYRYQETDGRLYLPVPLVEVRGTAEPGGRLPTLPAPPTAAPTATPTATATQPRTPGVPGGRVFLPLVANGAP